MLRRFVAPLAAAVVLVPASGFAQTAVWRLPSSTGLYRTADDAQVSYYDARRTAYDQGYREGIKEGEKDGRKSERFNYQDEREFQRADRGYNRSFGDRERYRQIFRDGYTAGYSEAFGRYSRVARTDGRYQTYPYPSARGPYSQQGPYPSARDPYSQQAPYPSRGVYGPGVYRSGGYYSPAFDNGARDGYEKGQEDARKSRSFDPLRHSWYRSGDRHYEDRYGSKQQYKDTYRQGFQQGYDQGFREGRYN
jgi:flagellar biosynthesis/type III secretory pathway protein FliH